MKVTYTIICSANPDHQFPVVYDVEDETVGEDTADEFCPFCGVLVRVKIQGKLKPDTDVHRMLGFKQD